MDTFVCGCDKQFRSACKGLPFYAEHKGERYCVLHFPGEHKEVDFQEALDSKFKNRDFNFRGVYFASDISLPRGLLTLASEVLLGLQRSALYVFDTIADFSGATFKGNATFQGVTFEEEASFRGATFEKNATFLEATFKGRADFSRSTFKERTVTFFKDASTFSGVIFEGEVDFSGATFKKETSFYQTNFKQKANFSEVTFDGQTSFHKATFEGEAEFREPTFRREANFSRAVFEEVADFSKSTFKEKAVFFETNFKGSPAAFFDANNFNRAVFEEEANFTAAIFEEEMFFYEVNFEGIAKFRRTTFKGGASFSTARFKGEAAFSHATFGGEATFSGATFIGRADFEVVPFKDKAIFSEAIFEARPIFARARFEGETHFRSTIFREGAILQGRDTFKLHSVVNLQDALIEKPELFSFHTVKLRPSWFINTDARKFNFTNVEWYGLSNGRNGAFEDEIETLQARGKEFPYGLLAKACRELAVNAEESRVYSEASKFNYWAMEAQRKEKQASTFAPWSLTWWYFLLSGYGEKPFKALRALIIVWLAFAVLYWQIGSATDENCAYSSLNLGEALAYSLGALTLQAQDSVNCVNGWAFSLLVLEGALGPLQIALLALALRRRFMR
jgi:uncharacterized protein YjbI with pentapeptide repeats